MTTPTVLNRFEQPTNTNLGDNRLVLAGTTQLSGTVLQSNGNQAAAIADPSGGATQDAEARTAIDSILAALRNTGIIAS